MNKKALILLVVAFVVIFIAIAGVVFEDTKVSKTVPQNSQGVSTVLSPSALSVDSTSTNNNAVSSNPVVAATQFPYELLVGSDLSPTIINLEAATTTAEQEHGLSDRVSLSADQGMLFAFPAPGYYQFWMINMSFPLDMIWLDQNYKVVGLKQDATPASYPATFTSDAPATYVIEVNNGFVNQYGIKEGDTLDVQEAQ